MHGERLPIAVAIGDPNGIGPEIAVKAALALKADEDPGIVLVGDPFVVGHYAARAGASIGEGRGQIRLYPVAGFARSAFRPGAVTADAGQATIDACAAAMALARSGAVSAIVGCPHSETAVNSTGTPFSGYPSLLARLAGVSEDKVFLMLVGGGLRIVHATLHEQLSHALRRLTPELVCGAAFAAAEALGRLGIENPRIGVFGINPHAGEDGLFGDDDRRVTEPAVATLRTAGLRVEGPVGADLMLARSGFDGFVAMYHDQGHIPIKLMAGRTASALSIGAGLLFSSVGHGAAFDIAGQDRADPEAVLRTVRLLGSAEPRSPTLSTGVPV